MEYSFSSASYRSTCFWRYDVFLSFRGEDTGGRFTYHLYKALERKGICTFKEDSETNKVTNLYSQPLRAIEVSRVAVVVVSKNYASSSWCLDELVKIFECKKQMGMKIMPIFYQVDPSDFRNQRGSFEESFVKHEAMFGEDNSTVRQWRKALFKIANLKAWVLNDRSHESEIVEDICEAIMRIIKPTLTLIEKEQLIGLSSKLDQLSSLLNPNSDDNVKVMVVGIHGMGGIGKTTIARALYERIRNEFEAHCFFSNVGEEFEISRITYLRGIYSKNTKILLVLDDVYSSYRIGKLILDFLGFGSRIIITTRDADLLSTLGVKRMFKMKELEHEEALQLFSLNAFKDKSPKEGYLEHSNRIVKLVGGNPLALRTLGSSLQNKDLSVWNNVIERLQGNFKWLGVSYCRQPSVEEEDKEPILQRYSSLESGLSCLDGLTEVQKLKIELVLLSYQKRFKSSRDSDEITFTDDDTFRFRFKNTTRDHFCLLQGEGHSYIDLMEKLLRLRNQLMPTKRMYKILQRKCSKSKEDVLQKIATKELEYAEKVYLISRRRYLGTKASTKEKSSDEDLLKQMIRQRKEIMKFEGEYFGLLQAEATFFDHKLSRYSEDVLQRAVSSRREFLGLEKLYTDHASRGTWSMFDVQPSYFERAEQVTYEMESLWEEQEMYPNLAHDSNIDYKINSLQRIESLRRKYLELEDKYLWKLLERYAKNHDNTSTSFDVCQIHLEYVWEYVFEMILRWRTDLTLFEDIHACQLKERGCSEKSAHEFAKSIEELKEVEREYCQLIRGRHLTILDSISSMDVTQIYTKYNDLELLNHIESQKKKSQDVAI